LILKGPRAVIDALYIVRHGIAVEPGTPGIADDERRLTAKGRKRMRQIARGLRRLDLNLDRIVTSPLPRARETAEIVADALGAKDRLETADVLRASSEPAAIQSWLRERAEERLMIVGHNPSFSDLIALLVLGPTQPEARICELKKGGVASLGPAPSSPDRHQLLWLATPRLLRGFCPGK